VGETNKRIKELRKATGLSQRKFGERLKITGSAVNKLENGENNPSDQTIKILCTEFGVDYFWLTEGRGEMLLPPDTDDETIDKIMTGSDEYARSVMKNFAKVADDQDWEMLAGIVESMKRKLRRAGL
jgi:transcriptional regulator with XRE-family HTH domain